MDLTPTSVFIVDDEPAHTEAVRRALLAAWPAVEVRTADRLAGFRAQLRAGAPDIALIDLNLPDGRALEMLTSPPERGDYPILIMTSFGNEQTAVEALKAGALDYVVKSEDVFAGMARIVERALREWALLRQHRRDQEELAESQTRFRLLVESAPDGVFVQSDACFAYLNPAALRLFGAASADLLVGQPIVSRVDPRYHEQVKERIRAVNERREAPPRAEQVFTRLDGSLFDVEVASTPIQWDGRDGALVFFRDVSARKANQARLAGIWRAAPVGIGVVRDRVFLEVNDRCCEMLGYTREELVGSSSRLVYPDDEAYEYVGREKYRQIALTGTGTVQTRWRRRDGTVRDVLLTSTILLRDAPDQGTVFTALDVTDERAAHRALRESEERYRRIVDTATEGIWVTDVEQRVVFVNERVAEMLGYTREEMMGRRAEEALFPDDLPGDEAEAESFRAGQAGRRERRLRRKDGSVLWTVVSSTPLSDGAGQYVGSLGMATDISSYKAALEQLEAARQYNEEIINNVGNGIVVYDAEMRIQTWNPCVEKCTGWAEAEVVGHRLLELFPDLRDQGVGDYLARAFAGEVLSSRDLHVTRRDGRDLWYVGTYAPHRNSAGEVAGVIASLTDVTERRRAEQEALLVARVLEVLARPADLAEALGEILALVRKHTRVEAVGLRLAEGEDFPYYQTIGFPADFVERERSLCAPVAEGDPPRDADGRIILDCICGQVVNGPVEAVARFFTPFGSFWTNRAGDMASGAASDLQQVRARGLCFSLGHESIVLIPLREEGHTIGLLQLCHTQRDWFSLQEVEFLERVSRSIGIALRRKQVLEKLQQSEETAWAMLNATRDLALLLDTEGCIITANEAMARSLHSEAATLEGHPLAEVLPSVAGDQREERLAEVLSSGEPVRFEDRRGDREFATSMYPVLDDAGRVVRVVLFAQDVTYRRQAEEAQRLAAVGQLAGGVAHEFNNLLFSLWLHADIAASSPSIERVRALSDEVREAARRGSTICEDLMSFARPTPPRRRRMAPEEPIEAALNTASRQLANSQIAVERQFRAGETSINADPAQLQQVYLNLIINACHAMAEGGVLTIRTEVEPGGSGQDRVLVTVADTGTGIRPEHLPMVFQPFFTTKGSGAHSETPGTGLGLAVTHGVIAAHKGTIVAKSVWGNGASFELRFPACAPEGDRSAPEAVAAPGEREWHLDGLRLLLVDDEVSALESMRRALTEVGCHVRATGRTREAIEWLADTEFDLVITDLLLPDGNGGDVLAAANALETPPKVLVITGKMNATLERELRAAGVSDILCKPFGLTEIFSAVANVAGTT